MKPRYTKKPPRRYKYEISFTEPILKETDSGVYKMIIDDKWFYIGSSNKLRRRFSYWRTSLRGGKGLAQNMKSIIGSIKFVKFEIIEFVYNAQDVLVRENMHIQLHFNDDNCLNHCPSSFNIKGFIKYKGYVKPVKVRGMPTQPKKVAMIDSNGDIVKIFPSIESAKREGYQAHKVLRKKMITSKGFRFRFLDENGNIVHIEKVRKKRDKLSERTKELLRKKAIDFAMTNKDKNTEVWQKMIAYGKSIQIAIDVYSVITKQKVGSCPSINEVARKYSLDYSNIRRVLKGVTKSHKGYTFKYA